MTMTTTIRCPTGTYGLAVAPWSPTEVYAVAARWSEAGDTVQTWARDRWIDSGRQVAEFRHEPAAALAAAIREVCESDEEAEGFAANARAIDDGNS